jgi:hypothetical protein
MFYRNKLNMNEKYILEGVKDVKNINYFLINGFLLSVIMKLIRNGYNIPIHTIF